MRRERFLMHYRLSTTCGNITQCGVVPHLGRSRVWDFTNTSHWHIYCSFSFVMTCRCTIVNYNRDESTMNQNEDGKSPAPLERCIFCDALIVPKEGYYILSKGAVCVRCKGSIPLLTPYVREDFGDEKKTEENDDD